MCVFLMVTPSLLWGWPPPALLVYVTAGMKCEGTSWKIALEIKAKTSPPLQKNRKEGKKEGAEASTSAPNITVMGCLTRTLYQWALHYGSFEAICTALGFDAWHVHVHVLNGSGRRIMNRGRFVHTRNIAVILLLQNPGWKKNTGITPLHAWLFNVTLVLWYLVLLYALPPVWFIYIWFTISAGKVCIHVLSLHWNGEINCRRHWGLNGKSSLIQLKQ